MDLDPWPHPVGGLIKTIAGGWKGTGPSVLKEGVVLSEPPIGDLAGDMVEKVLYVG